MARTRGALQPAVRHGVSSVRHTCIETLFDFVSARENENNKLFMYINVDMLTNLTVFHVGMMTVLVV